MSKNKRIVFYGTPDFAVPSLKALLEEGYNIVGVITSRDKPAGRGHKIQFSKVKEYALENNLNILQPDNLKGDKFLKELRSLNPDLQIVVAFRMIPYEVYSLPKYGTFNLHGSLLPKYRGAAPIHWAIINGEEETGLTTFLLNDKIDQGEIIFQYKTPINRDETTGELYNRLMHEGGKLVIKTTQAIFNNNYPRISQNKLGIKPSLAPKITKENNRIIWDNNGQDIVNFIRGMCPYPCANTSFIGENTGKRLDLKVFKGVFHKLEHKKTPGFLEFYNNKEIRGYCKDGYVQLIDIQQGGKKRMNDIDFLRGVKFDDNFQEINK